MYKAFAPPLYLFSLFIILLGGCSPASDQVSPQPSTEETAILLSYLEENGDLVNSQHIPSLVTPEAVFEKLSGANQLVIDLRTDSLFALGHIQHAVNIQPADILQYFEELIDPNAYDSIILVCSDGMLSGYVNGVLRYLGYDNVFTMRNGLSAWNMEIAEDYWLPAMSSHMLGRLETEPHPKNAAGPLPELATGRTSGYDILRARAEEVLQLGEGDMVLPAAALTADPSPYYVINYWPLNLYQEGHIEGAIQYTPKASLHSGQDLFTLPADRPIALYCYTAHHSAFATAFLRLLGYDAHNVVYGANSFIHQTMHDFGIPTRTFDARTPRGFPLVKQGEQGPVPDEMKTLTDTLSVEGGC
ncbi:MAG: rhodanese-like domain-containing protein [Bacteroidales bacterium]